MKAKKRTFKQIKNHYEVEKEIANRLRTSTRDERKSIYKSMYSELFSKVPDHPRLTGKKSGGKGIKRTLDFLKNFITPSSIFAEFGPGDCKLAVEISKKVKYVYAIDISDQSGENEKLPENFEHIVYNGYNLGLKDNSVDVVFSNQLIEHLHPDDTKLHFELVKRILKPRGKYVFITPHNFTGPHDISGYFSDVAEGFHLKEWSYGELYTILKGAYSFYTTYWGAKSIRIRIPISMAIILEGIIGAIPKKPRKILSRFTGLY